MRGLELHWMGDGPAGTKKTEKSTFWWLSRRTVWSDCSLSRGTPRVHVPTAEIFKETTTYFRICHNLSIFSPSRLWLPYNFFSVYLYFSTLFLQKKLDPRVLDLTICYLLGRRLHLSRLEKIILNPIASILFYMQYYSVSISVFSCFMAE